MVEMSSSFRLPPVIRRFGRCGETDQMVPSPSEVTADSSQSTGKIHRKGHARSSSFRGAGTGTERVKSFVNGIVSPFTACLQPSAGTCVPSCAPDLIFETKPSVISPYAGRLIPRRDSRVEQEDSYSRHPRHLHRTGNINHRLSRTSSMSCSAIAPPSAVSSRREPATVESDLGQDAATKTTITYEKRKRNTDIAKPRSNDILCGRGGSSNRHLGNIHFRELVAANKQIYVGLTKKQKMLVARKIVNAIHKTGGRFLAKDLDTGMFYDIGLPRSLEKTSQALREKHSNEMPVQSVEGEGIETSVESHHSVMKSNKSTDESQQAPDDATTRSPSSSKVSSKSSKKTEAPSLIIPSHLMKIFGEKGSNAQEENWENQYCQQTLSPVKPYNSEQPYNNHHSPYLPSSYRIPPGLPSPHHHGKSYQPVAGYPPAPSSHPYYRRPPYPPSPVPSGAQYRPHPHYYHHGRHPQTPPYGGHSHGPDERYAYPSHDEREAYGSEYYSRPADYEQAALRSSPRARPTPPAHYHRFPGNRLSPRHQSHPVPHGSLHPPSPGPRMPPRATFGPHVSPPSPSLYQASQRGPHHYQQYENGGSPPAHPPRHDGSYPTRILYNTRKAGYVRGTSDVSPTRQRELKRRRNSDDHTTRSADASLSSAVKNSLSLDERVVGRERKKQQQQKQKETTSGQTQRSSSPKLVSPSAMMQSTSCSRRSNVVENESGRASPTEKKEDYSTLSGLAALSTAAFLKLDEHEDK